VCSISLNNARRFNPLCPDRSFLFFLLKMWVRGFISNNTHSHSNPQKNKTPALKNDQNKQARQNNKIKKNKTPRTFFLEWEKKVHSAVFHLLCPFATNNSKFGKKKFTLFSIAQSTRVRLRQCPIYLQ
jgi:hypothetical protein